MEGRAIRWHNAACAKKALPTHRPLTMKFIVSCCMAYRIVLDRISRSSQNPERISSTCVDAKAVHTQNGNSSDTPPKKIGINDSCSADGWPMTPQSLLATHSGMESPRSERNMIPKAIQNSLDVKA